jgi:hypothetical protein
VRACIRSRVWPYICVSVLSRLPFLSASKRAWADAHAKPVLHPGGTGGAGGRRTGGGGLDRTGGWRPGCFGPGGGTMALRTPPPSSGIASSIAAPGSASVAAPGGVPSRRSMRARQAASNDRAKKVMCTYNSVSRGDQECKGDLNGLKCQPHFHYLCRTAPQPHPLASASINRLLPLAPLSRPPIYILCTSCAIAMELSATCTPHPPQDPLYLPHAPPPPPPCRTSCVIARKLSATWTVQVGSVHGWLGKATSGAHTHGHASGEVGPQPGWAQADSVSWR